ncbi:Rho-type gtpase-activating protein [Dimargaris xerosporica]|nr:Rho-type gtpase-activating protein [Dimargaris xerosporica]
MAAHIPSDSDDQPAVCSGCKELIDEGSVVSFGDGIWHIDCFRCSKCKNLIEGDANLLLLADGSPLCQNCSYTCSICQRSILDEAIVTGDDSYHFECFRCSVCHNQIQGSCFAKTTQGIFCMTCFRERKARKKAARKKARDGLQTEKSLPAIPVDPTSVAPHPNSAIEEARQKLEANSYRPPASGVALAPKPSPTVPSVDARRSVSTSDEAQSQPMTPQSATLTRPNDTIPSTPAAPSTTGLDRSPSTTALLSGPAKSMVPSPAPVAQTPLLPQFTFDPNRRDSFEQLTKMFARASLMPVPREIQFLDSNAPKIPELPLAPVRGRDQATTDGEAVDPMLPNGHKDGPDWLQTATRMELQYELLYTQQRLLAVEANFKTLRLQYDQAEQSMARLQQEIKAKADAHHQADSGLQRLQVEYEQLRYRYLDATNTRLPVTEASTQAKRLSDAASTVNALQNQVQALRDTVSRLEREKSEWQRSHSASMTDLASLRSDSDLKRVSVNSNGSGIGMVPSNSMGPVTDLEMRRRRSTSSTMPNVLGADGRPGLMPAMGSVASSKSTLVGNAGGELHAGNSQLDAQPLSPRFPQSGTLGAGLGPRGSPHMGHPTPSLSATSTTGSHGEGEAIQKVITKKFKWKGAAVFGKKKPTADATPTDATTGDENAKATGIQISRPFNPVNASGNSVASRPAISNPMVHVGEPDTLDAASAGYVDYNNASSPARARHAAVAAAAAAAAASKDGSTTLHRNISGPRPLPKFITPQEAAAIDKSLPANTSPQLVSTPQTPANNHPSASTHPPNAKAGSLRQHMFQQQAFLRPVKCDMCADKIWNIQVKDLRCTICNYNCHAKCLLHVPPNCPGADYASNHVPLSGNTLYLHQNGILASGANQGSPGSSTNDNGQDSMFGQPLLKQLGVEQREVPWIIQACIHGVEANGMLLEGIYRKSGPVSDVRALHQQIVQIASTGGHRSGHPKATPQLRCETEDDVTTLTSILKQYLRDLPEPLLTFDAYPKFIEAIHLPDLEARCKAIQPILHQLPHGHQTTMRFLMKHWLRVHRSAAHNKMPSKNLAVVLGPNLMRTKANDTGTEFKDMSAKNSVVELLISQAGRFWPSESVLGTASQAEQYAGTLFSRDNSVKPPRSSASSMLMRRASTDVVSMSLLGAGRLDSAATGPGSPASLVGSAVQRSDSRSAHRLSTNSLNQVPTESTVTQGLDLPRDHRLPPGSRPAPVETRPLPGGYPVPKPSGPMAFAGDPVFQSSDSSSPGVSPLSSSENSNFLQTSLPAESHLDRYNLDGARPGPNDHKPYSNPYVSPFHFPHSNSHYMAYGKLNGPVISGHQGPAAQSPRPIPTSHSSTHLHSHGHSPGYTPAATMGSPDHRPYGGAQHHPYPGYAPKPTSGNPASPAPSSNVLSPTFGPKRSYNRH